MKTEFSKQEKEFFRRHKRNDSRIKTFFIAITVFLLTGVFFDALNGFGVIREAKSITWGIGGIFLLSIFYLVGEVGVGWISAKDNVSHPLYKRAFHLALLLGYTGSLIIIMLAAFKYSCF